MPEIPADAARGPVEDGGRAPAEGPGPLRVMIVDDQALVRGGFAMLIGSQPDLDVVAQAGDGAQAAREADRLAAEGRTPQIVLMDVRMPGTDGITATRQILARHPETRVIVLTTFDLDEYALSAIRAGASGFLLKDARPEELLGAIRTCARGDAVIAPSTTRRLLEHLVAASAPDSGLDSPSGPGRPAGPTGHAGARPRAASPDPRLAGLTERELEVLVHLGRGRSNAEIAADLFLSATTVKTHVSNVLRKIGARDRVQAVVVAYETGLVGGPG